MTYEQQNRKFELKYYKKIIKALKPTDVISVVRQRGPEAAISYLTTKAPMNEEVGEVVLQLYQEVGLTHARNQQRERKDEIQKGFGLNETWLAFIEQYLRRFALEMLTFEVSNTLRNRMVLIIEEGIREGLGRGEIAKELESEDLTKVQAARIARTEVNRASNVGHAAQASTSVWQQTKEWISAKDKRVRGQDEEDHASHIALNGVKIDENEKFTDPINGDQLDIPGDTTASAASTINCRCRVVYRAKRDLNGKLIRK